MTSLCDIAYSDLCDFFYLQTTKKSNECHYKTSHGVKCPREKDEIYKGVETEE